MQFIFSVLLFLVFLTISILHFYWVFGGTKGLNKALPTNEKGKRVLNPKKVETTLVALGLLLFGIFYLQKTNLRLIILPDYYFFRNLGTIIPILFTIRAIGDFKYIGFFKKIKNTEFGKFDTKLISFFCLTIGIIGFLLIYIEQL